MLIDWIDFLLALHSQTNGLCQSVLTGQFVIQSRLCWSQPCAAPTVGGLLNKVKLDNYNRIWLHPAQNVCLCWCQQIINLQLLVYLPWKGILRLKIGCWSQPLSCPNREAIKIHGQHALWKLFHIQWITRARQNACLRCQKLLTFNDLFIYLEKGILIFKIGFPDGNLHAAPTRGE